MGVRYCETWSSSTNYAIDKVTGAVRWSGDEAFIRNYYYSGIFEFNARLNDSIVNGDGHGLMYEGVFNGCLGLMQRNQSDFTSVSVDYPLSAQNLSVFQVMWSQYFELLSLETAQWMNRGKMFINPFDQSTTVAIVFAVSLMCLVYTLFYSILTSSPVVIRILRPGVIHVSTRTDTYSTMFLRAFCKSSYLLKFILGKHTINWDRMNSRSKSLRLIVILCTLGTFCFTAIFLSSLSTDLTIRIEGEHLDTYAKLVEKNCSIYLLSENADKSTFARASANTYQHELWTHNRPKSPFKWESFLTPDIFDLIAEKKIVFVASDTLLFRQFFCNCKESAHKENYTVRTYRQPESFIRGFAAGIGFNSDKLVIRLKRSFEHDLITPIFTHMWPSEFRKTFLMIKMEKFDACMRGDSESGQKHEFKQVSLHLVRYPLKLCVSLLIAAFFVLSIENLLIQRLQWLKRRHFNRINKDRCFSLFSVEIRDLTNHSGRS